MKFNKLIYAIALFGITAPVLTACDTGGGEVQKEFSFTAALKSGKSTLETGDTDQIMIYTNGANDSGRSYTYSSNIEERATVTEDGIVTAGQQNGQVTITVKETVSGLTFKVKFNVTTPSSLANGGFNYSASAGEEAVEKRTEILGKLEKYAVDTHLTGITLFENGGYVRYNPRIDIPANEYITGYGFGILSEGNIKSDLPTETIDAYKKYYHSAQTNNPNKINAWNDTGSQVSDLSSYITGSYWGTKMNATKDGYVWYPMFAADKVSGKDNTRPIPVGEENPLGLYKTWKIYVKTADNMRAAGSTKPLKYRHPSNTAGFDGRDVKLEDYKFVYQLLLTGANGLTRGTEMAGDKSYGIKGAQIYYNRTKDLDNQAAIDNIWNEMTLSNATTGTQDPTRFNEQQLGIMTGTDAGGDYIQLEIVNEIDAFTAMYTLSSNLVSPIPRSFIEYVGGNVIDGAKNYGQNNDRHTLVENTISVGAYKLDVWNDNYIAFGLDENYFEKSDSRYLIPGVKITTFPNASQEQLYQYYDQQLIDSCGLPISHIKTDANKPDVRVTKGDSTFKLNVNSCTQERWNELFSNHGSIAQNDPAEYWTVKPWMSNDAFLKGLYWSINREQFAANRGVTPSINYFADAYLSDPENGVSYNSTDAHKQAVANYHTSRVVDGKVVDNYGYDLSKAVNYFKQAVQQLTRQGVLDYGTSTEDPTVINIHIKWMYQTDIADYGEEIAKYFEDAFNNDAVSGGLIKLEVTQDAVTTWDDVYNEVMMKGKFDLAFGAISGNTYNPLNFLEVLKSDNSSGFTLNWGPDTSKVDQTNPLVYDGNKWAFDALWEVSDRGGVVQDGSIVKTVKNCYLNGMWKDLTSGNPISTLANGGDVNVALEFVDLDSVKIDINKVQVYVSGGSNTDVTSFTYDKDDKKLSMRISAELAQELKSQLNEIVNKGKNPGDEGYVNDPLTRDALTSKGYYSFEIYYSLSIKVGDKWGTPTQSYITVAATAEDQL